jgi:hypothetical protein
MAPFNGSAGPFNLVIGKGGNKILKALPEFGMIFKNPYGNSHLNSLIQSNAE